MIPKINHGIVNVKLKEIPTKTFFIDKDKIASYCDNIEAMKQAISLLLSTEKNEHLIFNTDYGVEFSDLIGRPASFVYSEIKRRITESLLYDKRILNVSDFSFNRQKNKVITTFCVTTIYGEVKSEVSKNV